MKFFIFPTICALVHLTAAQAPTFPASPIGGALQANSEFVRLPSQPHDVRLDGVTKLEFLAANDNDCDDDSVQRDFGTACLKKAIVTSNVEDSDDDTRAAHDASSAAAHLNRHISIKPMLSPTDGARPHILDQSKGIKSPAFQARELYESKGYKYPTKSVKTLGGTKFNTAPLSPSNNFYNMNKNRLRPTLVSSGGVAPGVRKGPNKNSMGETIEPGVPFTFDQEPVKPSTSVQSNQAFAEELEMLQSLKRSLGVLSAQALNLRQRTEILYREARSKKLTFFDSLLSRTATFLNDKLIETRSALEEIDKSMSQIQQHQQASSLQNLRRTFFRFSLGKQVVLNQNTVQRVPKSKLKRNVPKIDQEELDQLISGTLEHAKKMMRIIRELNEALDEFEEQFNLARFEPNTIDDNVIETGSYTEDV